MKIPATTQKQLLEQKSVIFIVGPTAVGKTAAGIQLARALKTEIISADSMQVYRGMNIGTAKPTVAERKAVKHHLINVVKPSQLFSAHLFRSKALKLIKELHRKGKIPIVVGGTGLYVRALLEGFSGQPGTDRVFRSNLKKEMKLKGLDAVYKRLKRLDPKRARNITPHDERRITRALEIIHLSKKKPSDWYQKKTDLKSLGLNPIVIGLNQERSLIYDRINKRVDRMFKDGLVKEVKQISKTRMSKTSSLAVGYKEVREVLKQNRPKKSLSKDQIELLKDSIKQNTRRFAKRQLTWFRKENGIQWIQLPTKLSNSAIEKSFRQALSRGVVAR